MPRDFDPRQNGIRKLRSVNRGGSIWATFADDAPSFEEYCGAEVLAEIDHMLPGKKLKLLGYSREQFLLMQMAGMLFFALGIPLSARYGDRWGTRRTMIVASVLIIGFGVLFAPLFQPHSPWLVTAFLCLGLFLIGPTYGP
ncbi:MFS transporter, partial [Escherichia coli]|uniref:MFS transporter n=1 Tax=Escherichia coli TaxID=562 RepID=UPI00192A447F